MRRLVESGWFRAACVAGALCGGIAAARAAWLMPARLPAKRERPALATAVFERPALPPVRLPEPGPRAAERGAVAGAPRTSTPEAQAAAAARVSAGSLVRALAQAAAQGDARAVDDLMKGLPRYGQAAREKLEEELGRAKSPKSREALSRALALLNS